MTALREKFSSRLGFVLATAGSAVGIGNLVGFPVNAAKNGGGAFLLIYLVFVFLQVTWFERLNFTLANHLFSCSKVP